MSMKSEELRDQFLNFFESKNHRVLPSASLVPKDDSSVLFTSAGMQQFRKFYSSPDEAPASAIATCQKCIRTSDIDEVGDETHLTFFEMLGNFSFGSPKKEGSYFKKEAIEYAWEFLTEVLKIDKNRLSATYFKGEGDISADVESLSILKEVTGLSDNKITGTGKDETFWSLGTEGSPGGPTVEFYIDGVEIWNLVFNQYVMQNGKYIPSEFCGVDTGMGLERLAATMQNKSDVFETDLFTPIIKKIEELSSKKYQQNQRAFRIIADHLKAVTLLISEDILPSNKDQGYIVRRLIRRAIVQANEVGIKENYTTKIAVIILEIYGIDQTKIIEELEKEESKFRKNLEAGLKLISAHKEFDAKILFDLYQSYGIPVEVTIEEVEKSGSKISDETIKQYNDLLNKHKELSRTASAGMFKGGLADAGEETTKLHTAAHLMLAAMREVLGDDVNQKGSNITAERLRFDFNYPEKLTDEQIKKIEDIVNENIKADLPVTMEELTIEDAKNSGATGVFDDRYGDKVKVYAIGVDDNIGNTSSTRSARSGSQNFVSREICGGPHVTHTGELGHFKITKEESSSAGIRRIKAILE